MSEGRRRQYREPAPRLTRCLACRGDGLRSFYGVQDIPVHLNHLAPTRSAARRAPTGNLELAFCPGCGFIQQRRSSIPR